MCNVNISTIKSLAKGKIQPSDIDEPFIIMRSKTHMRFIDEMYSYEYVVVFSNRVRSDKSLVDEISIDRKLALKLIEKCKMDPVAKDENTVLYETIGQPFQRKYAGRGLNLMMYI